MKVLLCLAGLVATTLASGWGWNAMGGNGGGSGGNWNNNMGGNNGGWNSGGGNNNNNNFWNMLMGRGNGGGHGGNMGGGHGSGMGGGHNGGGNMGQWSWGGQQQGGMGGNIGGNFGGMPQMGLGGGHGMWGLLMMSVLKNMHGNNQGCSCGNGGGNGRGNGGNGGDWNGNYDKGDVDMFEEYTKQEMAKELFDAMMKQYELKEKKGNFKEAMTYLCVYFKAITISMKKMNETNSWTEQRSDQFEAEVEGLDLEEIAVKMSDLRNGLETRQQFVDAGTKLAGWVCDAGSQLEMQMEKMEKKDKCEAGDKKDDSEDKDDGKDDGKDSHWDWMSKK